VSFYEIIYFVLFCFFAQLCGFKKFFRFKNKILRRSYGFFFFFAKNFALLSNNCSILENAGIPCVFSIFDLDFHKKIYY